MAIIDTVIEVLSGAQTEILIFIFAIFAHTALFGRYRIVSQGKTAGKSVSASKVDHSPGGLSKGGDSPVLPKSPSSTFQLVRSVQALLDTGAKQSELVEELKIHLSKLPSTEQVDAVTTLLTGLRKSISAELLAACRGFVDEMGLEPSARFHEGVLHSYLVLRQPAAFKAYLAEVEAVQGLRPSGAILAMRAAVQSSDLGGALARLSAVAEAWNASAGATASTAHAQLFRQLVRLAFDRDAFPALLDQLKDAGLVATWSVEHLISECVSNGSETQLKVVKALASAQQVGLSARANAVLIQGSKTASAVLAAVKEAASQGQGGEKEVILAAAIAASEHRAAAPLAEAVEGLLQDAQGPHAPEVAAAVLRLALPGGPLEGGALRLFEGPLQGAELSSDALVELLVANAAIKEGKYDVLNKVVAAADSSRQVALIKGLASERRLADCSAVFKACSQKTAYIYNALLDACIFCRDMAAAEKIMRQALDDKMADTVTYNTMIKAQLQSGSIRQARRLVDKMREGGLEPNVVTFNELIDAAIRCSPGDVWGLVDEMKACGLKPNHVTCSILLKGISRSSRPGDVERALALVESKEEPIDEVLLSSVCEACVRCGRMDLLQKQLQCQRGHGAVQIKGAHTFGSIIRAYGCLGDTAQVWDTWRDMKRRLILPTAITLGCMVEALASNGDPEAGYELIREQMGDAQMRPLVNAVIYCSVLKGFSHKRRFDRVWFVYKEMKSEKLQFSIVTYNTLIDACSRSHDMDRIPALLAEMTSESIEPNIITYSTVIKGYCQENSVDKALKLLDDMQKNKQLCPDEVTYNTLLDGCARYGMWEKGMFLLEEMQSAGVHPSNFTLSVLVKLANRSRRPLEAFKLCEDLCAKYHIHLNVHVYNNLMHACTSHGDLSKAFNVLESMLQDKVRPDARTYLVLLRGAVGAKSAEDAAGLLRAAVGLRGAHPKLAAYGTSFLQPKGGLPADTISEALEGIASQCNDEELAMQLLRDVRRAPGAPALDPRFSLSIASKACPPARHSAKR